MSQPVFVLKTSTLNWYTQLLTLMKNNILLCKYMYSKQGNDQLLTLLKNLRVPLQTCFEGSQEGENEEIIESSSNKFKAAWKTLSTSTKPYIKPHEFNSFCKTSVE
ncbi:hypothetical protein J6590_037126 [Homalodisca vitripennis]|nr:hypothetical protein J6590_037126 [Homalodisca vitripennis]